MVDYSVTVAMSGTPNTLGWYNVKAYGAYGLGAGTDESTQIQAAINAAKAAGGGTVYLPRGTYTVESELLINDAHDDAGGIFLKGDGINATSIVAGDDDITLIHWAGNWGGIDGIGLDGEGYDGTSYTGVSALRVTPEDEAQVITRVHQDYNQFSNIRIENCAEGIVLQCGPYVGGSVSGCYFNTFSSVYINWCTRGIWFKDGPNALASGSNRNQFFGVRVGLGMNTGIQIDNGGTNSFVGCSVEEVATGTSPSVVPTGIRSLYTAPVGTRGNGHNMFYGMMIEGCTRDIDMETTTAEFYGHSVVGARIMAGGEIDITGITKGATCTVTTDGAHGFIDGDRVYIDGGDMTEIDGRYAISGAASTTFVLVGVDSTAYTTYTTGGSAKYSGVVPNVFMSAQVATCPVGYKKQQFDDNMNINLGSGAPEIFVKGGGSPADDGFDAAAGSIILHTDGDVYTKESVVNDDWARLSKQKFVAGPADDTTPSVAGATILVMAANTAPTVITALDDPDTVQEVTLLCTATSNASTITDTPSGTFQLSANWTPSAGDTITLITYNGGTNWFEKCRSTNA